MIFILHFMFTKYTFFIYYRTNKHLSFLQRQDIDERLRRLQSDKDALALQVQVLTEQVSSQNDKIIDLERSLTDKTQLLNNTEDMLQRVSDFARSIGKRLDQQKVFSFLSLIFPLIYYIHVYIILSLESVLQIDNSLVKYFRLLGRMKVLLIRLESSALGIIINFQIDIL